MKKLIIIGLLLSIILINGCSYRTNYDSERIENLRNIEEIASIRCGKGCSSPYLRENNTNLSEYPCLEICVWD